MTPPTASTIIAPRCPVCGKATVAEHAPFCSRGCRDRDLIAWLSEDYRLPAAGPEGELEGVSDGGLDTGEEPA